MAFSALWHVAGVAGDSGVAVGAGVIPDFMGAGCLPVKYKSQFLELLDDLPVLEACQSTH